MTVKWIIQVVKRAEENNVTRIIYSLKELGVDFHILEYIPFGATEYNMFEDTDKVVFHGAISAVMDFQKRQPRPWKPFAWFDPAELKCSTYYAHWGKYLLQKNYAFYPWGDVLRNKDAIYARHGRDGDIFIRPDQNLKDFVGVQVGKSKIEWWAENEEIPLETLVVIAEPQKIIEEYRCIMHRKKVVTLSLYKLGGILDIRDGYRQGVIDTAEEIAASVPWEPEPIYCMDIAWMGDNNFKLIEIGSINCAGLYTCDVRKVVQAMTEEASS